MSQDSEKIRNLVGFKKKLEDQVGKLESDLSDLKAMLEIVNSILLEKGFKRGDSISIAAHTVTTPPPVPPKEPAEIEEESLQTHSSSEPESVIQLRTSNDESLAIVYVNDNSIHVLPDERKNFSVNTPPFSNFLVERVLTKMQQRDNELVRAGKLTTERMFTYTIVREGDLIREIVIKNVDGERLRELKSSIRWTLEKMYEKMKG
jgi:hypothetical protein